MKKILFISDYPNEDNIKEGMMQRIKKIDEVFRDYDKIYLSIEFNGIIDPIIIEKNNHCKVIKLNYSLHSEQIRSIIQSSTNIYIHSLYNFLKIRDMPLTGKNLIMDVHGVVPEELAYLGQREDASRFFLFEKELMKYKTRFIFVTETMKKYFKKKYGAINGLVYPILPNTLRETQKQEDLTDFKKGLNISENDVVIIYSGNNQKWQNIGLMGDIIAADHHPNHKFLILTRENEVFKKIFSKKKINPNKVIIKNVLPSQLKPYYQSSHYGFILRDKHILNAVACPTKIVEYMFYGVIPIVKYKRIGDFYSKKYDFIHYKKMKKLKTPQKSIKNQKIIKIMADKYKEENLLNLII